MNSTESMLNYSPMTNFDRILSEARELLTEEERRKLAMDLAPLQKDPELEASLTRGIAEMRAGLGTDAEEFLAELEAEDLAEAEAES